MGEDPGEIRQEIEESRERMGETVEAMSHKADVPARAKEYVAEKKDAVVSTVTGALPDLPDSRAVKQRASRARDAARRNPLGLTIGGAAVGFVVGLALPSTRIENERMGDMADQLKEQARDVGHEALDRGKQVAQEAADAAQRSGQEQGQQLTESLRDRAQEATSTSPGSE